MDVAVIFLMKIEQINPKKENLKVSRLWKSYLV